MSRSSGSSRALFAATLVAAGAVRLLAATPARAQTGEEPVDDPKLARRLGTRSFWTAPPMPGPPPASPPPPLAGVSPAAVPPAPGPPPASPPPPLAGVSPAVPPPPPTPPAFGAPVPWQAPPAPPPAWETAPPVIVETATPPSREAPRPRFKLAYRRFDFVQVGASGSSSGAVASEPFDSLSLDFYPISSLIRFGLSSQFGWQSGAGLTGGDYFAAESASLGAQLRGGPVVPFAETFAGVGYMRRLQFERTIPTAYWQLGIDVGAEIYPSRVGFLSLAIGYIRPVNGFAMQQRFGSIYVDTWSFKIGVGF